MGRPRTLGPAITFRLPLELHEIVALRAEANGLSVDEYVKTRFAAAVERDRDRLLSVHTPALPPDARQVNPRWKSAKNP